MNDASRTNTAGQKLRIDTNVRAGIHYHSARKQNTSQQPPLWMIGIRFKSAITEPVDRERVFVNLIANSAKMRNQGSHAELRYTAAIDSQHECSKIEPHRGETKL